VETLEKQVEDLKSDLASEVQSQTAAKNELVLLRGEVRRRNDELKKMEDSQVCRLLCMRNAWRVCCALRVGGSDARLRARGICRIRLWSARLRPRTRQALPVLRASPFPSTPSLALSSIPSEMHQNTCASYCAVFQKSAQKNLFEILTFCKMVNINRSKVCGSVCGARTRNSRS